MAAIVGSIALLAGAAVPAASPAALPGRYELVGVREAAGGLELGDDGRFRYALSYGALDEQAEGKWRLDGNRVLLTTDPQPRPPEFRLADATAGTPGLFRLRLENPAGQPIPNIDVVAIMADGTEKRMQTTTDWLEAPADPRQVPTAIRFHIPVFEVTSAPIAIDTKAARQFRFVLDPKDLGVRDFRDWPLVVNGDSLAPPDAPPGQGFQRVSGQE